MFSRAGETLVLAHPNFETPHLWILVTDPVGPPPQTIIVAVSTKRFYKDSTVVLSPGDHPWVQHESVIFYDHALIPEVRHLNEAVRRRIAELHQPCTPDVLRRVQDGLLSSPRTPQRVKHFYKDWLAKREKK